MRKLIDFNARTGAAWIIALALVAGMSLHQASIVKERTIVRIAQGSL